MVVYEAKNHTILIASNQNFLTFKYTKRCKLSSNTRKLDVKGSNYQKCPKVAVSFLYFLNWAIW